MPHNDLEKRVADLERCLAVLWAERNRCEHERFNAIRTWIVNGIEVRPSLEVRNGVIVLQFTEADTRPSALPSSSLPASS